MLVTINVPDRDDPASGRAGGPVDVSRNEKIDYENVVSRHRRYTVEFERTLAICVEQFNNVLNRFNRKNCVMRCANSAYNLSLTVDRLESLRKDYATCSSCNSVLHCRVTRAEAPSDSAENAEAPDDSRDAAEQARRRELRSFLHPDTHPDGSVHDIFVYPTNNIIRRFRERCTLTTLVRSDAQYMEMDTANSFSDYIVYMVKGRVEDKPFFGSLRETVYEVASFLRYNLYPILRIFRISILITFVQWLLFIIRLVYCHRYPEGIDDEGAELFGAFSGSLLKKDLAVHRLLSSTFLHNSGGHLIISTIMHFRFSSVFESIHGATTTLAVYFLASAYGMLSTCWFNLDVLQANGFAGDWGVAGALLSRYCVFPYLLDREHQHIINVFPDTRRDPSFVRISGFLPGDNDKWATSHWPLLRFEQSTGGFFLFVHASAAADRFDVRVVPDPDRLKDSLRTMEGGPVCAVSGASNVGGTPRKDKSIPAIDLINAAVATDWKRLERVAVPSGRSAKKARNVMADMASVFSSNLWAYIQPNNDVPANCVSGSGNRTAGDQGSSPASNTRSRERSCKAARASGCASNLMAVKNASGEPVGMGLERLFGKSNSKSHLFNFDDGCSSPGLKSSLDGSLLSEDRSGVNSQYSTTTLEDFERLSPGYAESVGSDFPSDVEDLKPTVPDAACPASLHSPMNALKEKCEKFFDHHGLVVKVRKLPAEGSVRRRVNGNADCNAKEELCYPAYHVISRQRAHMVEQLMRSRSFLNTRYNSSDEMRNALSPFSLIELRDGTVQHIENLRDDLCDPEFTGIFVSVSTKAFVSESEFGRVRRTKTVAWAMIELLTSNERCLRSLWVHSAISAPATTALLSALLPYSMVASMMVSPGAIDERYPVKTFCAWLSDFDTFPRQAMVLLTSPDRFGLIKHHDALDNARDAAGGSIGHAHHYASNLSHIDAGVSGDECYCYRGANWNDANHVIVSCTEQLMYSALPQWVKLVPERALPDLLDDLERIVLPESVSYNCTKAKESAAAIREAEYAGLSPLQIRDMLMYLYGSRWKSRVKPGALKPIKEQPVLPKPCFQQPIPMLDEREERRKRRAQLVSQA
ncbi:rhomboid-like peptidase [Babesia ovata]|uniref:Rhomboid-like peptidase n=1 Tax=Babesia ovata TaxID=189622 RepID=A0A2H6K9H3_9APIC|nr:rhomboid-like peptidase [Babesia ovata]GBE59647.1 rhomboid-like peptidase [Babesia ovata]